MKINWFPGHMKNALLMMEKELKNIDLIIYVLDSRAPFSCIIQLCYFVVYLIMY